MLDTYANIFTIRPVEHLRIKVLRPEQSAYLWLFKTAASFPRILWPLQPRCPEKGMAAAKS